MGRFVIVGATGAVGANFCRRLAAKGAALHFSGAPETIGLGPKTAIWT
jgi:uncharacterized protein YbjT (DUF2867 family)